MNTPALVSASILPAVLKLLRLRWLIMYNSFRHAKTKTRIWTIIAAFGLVALAAFIFWISWVVLGFLRSPSLAQYIGGDVFLFLQSVPALIFTALFLGILLTSFGVLLQALYLSGDMDFLLAAPVPIRAVFITKLLQAVLPSFGLAALFGLPILFGLGASAGYNMLYYPLVLMTMIALTLAAAGLSALLVMAVVRVFPARRIAEVLGFLGAIISMLCSQTGNLSNSMRAGSGISTGKQLGGLVSLIERFNSPWNPLNWAGRGLVELGSGRWFYGVLLVGLTLGLTLAAFWFALVTAERWYYSGWAGMQVISNKKKTSLPARAATEQSRPLAGLFERFLPAPVRAIVRRDFMILTRDLRQMSQLVSPLIFGLLYSFMFLRNGSQVPAGRGAAPTWFMDSLGSLLAYGNVGMSLIVGWMLLSHLSGNAISREGKNYWILKASPLRPWYLLLAKFIVAYLPALAMGWFFMIGISIMQGISLAGFLYGLLAVSMCLAGMDGILLGFGALTANLEWQDSRKISSGRMGCLGSILTGLFLPVGFGLFIAPLWVAAIFQLPLAFGYLVGLVFGVGVTGLCAWLPLNMAQSRIDRLGE
jgi:hypothetical protein